MWGPTIPAVEATPPRRTQQERRDATRRALLDATVACLTELGYAGTSTLEVQKRAGVSRGALLHHFPSKASLLVAAVPHLAELRGRELRRLSRDLPEEGRLEGALSLLWESFSGPLFLVATELRYAAREDEELRRALVAAERQLHADIFKSFRELFGPLITQLPAFEEALELSIHFMSGLAMTSTLHQDPERLRQLLAQWRQVFVRALESAPPGPASQDPASPPAERASLAKRSHNRSTRREQR